MFISQIGPTGIFVLNYYNKIIIIKNKLLKQFKHLNNKQTTGNEIIKLVHGITNYQRQCLVYSKYILVEM